MKRGGVRHPIADELRELSGFPPRIDTPEIERGDCFDCGTSASRSSRFDADRSTAAIRSRLDGRSVALLCGGRLLEDQHKLVALIQRDGVGDTDGVPAKDR
jgi:hypothetical protein